MNYAWEAVLQAERNGRKRDRLRFVEAVDPSPYIEVSVMDLNLDSPEEDVVEINPLYRFEDVLSRLFDRNIEGMEQTRAAFFDICMHYIVQLDLREGLSKECIKDLNGDGREELVLGSVCIDTPLELFGRIYDEACKPFVIYTYEGEDIKWSSIKEEYIMLLYEGGIVELIFGGVSSHFMYYQAGEEFKCLDIIVEEQYQEEEPRYYRCVYEDDGRTTEYVDITEEEFHRIRNRYATSAEELDWKPLEGFWEPEIMLNLYDLEQILNGNLRVFRSGIWSLTGNITKIPEDI